jgi:hypothetical protein
MEKSALIIGVIIILLVLYFMSSSSSSTQKNKPNKKNHQANSNYIAITERTCDNVPAPRCVVPNKNGSYSTAPATCPNGVNWECDYYSLDQKISQTPSSGWKKKSGVLVDALNDCNSDPTCGWGTIQDTYPCHNDVHKQCADYHEMEYGTHGAGYISGFAGVYDNGDNGYFLRVPDVNAAKSFISTNKTVSTNTKTNVVKTLDDCEKSCFTQPDCYGYVYLGGTSNNQCTTYELPQPVDVSDIKFMKKPPPAVGM